MEAKKNKAGLSKFAPAKEIVKLDAEGNIVAKYPSLTIASREQGFSGASGIQRYVGTGMVYKGHTFEYSVPKPKVFEMPKIEPVFDHMKHIPYGR